MDRERPSHTFLELCKYNHMQGNFLFRISIRIICRYILENSFERVTIFCFWSSSFSTAFLPKLSIKEKPCLIQVCLHRPNDGLTGSEPANSSNYCFNFVQEHFIITSLPPTSNELHLPFQILIRKGRGSATCTMPFRWWIENGR